MVLVKETVDVDVKISEKVIVPPLRVIELLVVYGIVKFVVPAVCKIIMRKILHVGM